MGTTGPGRGDATGLVTDAIGAIDLEASSDRLGISAAELVGRFVLRRRETCRSAYLAFWTGVALFVLWSAEMLSVRWSGSRLLPALEFLPACVALFALSLRSAWTNWQLRTCRLGSLSEFLSVREGFLPG